MLGKLAVVKKKLYGGFVPEKSNNDAAQLRRRKSRVDQYIDPLRTRWWTESAMASLGVESAYALEKRVNPEGMRRTDEGVFYHSNRWSSYRQGKFVPRPLAVSMVEAVVPGSARVLHHPLWEFLRRSGEPSSPRQTAMWLETLSVEHRRVLFNGPSRIHRKTTSESMVRKLSLRVDLDSVLALSILLQEVFDQGSNRLIENIGETLFALLIRWGTMSDIRELGLLIGLFEVLKQRVFSFADNGRMQIFLDDIEIADLVVVLRHSIRSGWGVNDRKVGAREWLNTVRCRGEYGIVGGLWICCPWRPTCRGSSDQGLEKHYRITIAEWHRAISEFRSRGRGD